MSQSLPFALATLRAADDRPFAALVRDGRATALGRHLTPDVTVRRLIGDWDAVFPALQALADRLTAAELEYAIDDLHRLPPLMPPGEIFQAGANYRQHVLDLMSGAEHAATPRTASAAPIAIRPGPSSRSACSPASRSCSSAPRTRWSARTTT
jgi:2,4-diketo-3-deoxy-L-fuconate hydrolase